MARLTRKAVESPTGVFVARSAGVFKIKGKLYRYRRGETFPAGHPLLGVRPDAFMPLSFDTTPEVRAD